MMEEHQLNFKRHIKVISLYCIAHPYCARFIALLVRAHSMRKSKAL